MTVLAPAKVPFEDGACVTVAVTGGTIFPLDSETGFSPVKSYAGGRITVLGFVDRLFLRGDANGDSRVDLSDEVTALGHLFLGNVDLACVDAADTDDSGVVEITDPIFLLLALETHADLLLIDEASGREAAAKLCIKRSGLLGVLLEAKQRGLIPSLAGVLESLVLHTSFRVQTCVRAGVPRLAGEGTALS